MFAVLTRALSLIEEVYRASLRVWFEFTMYTVFDLSRNRRGSVLGRCSVLWFTIQTA